MLDPVVPVEPGSLSGQQTLLFTDIEGSTRLLAELGDASYAELLAIHHDLIRVAIAAHSGAEQGTGGDSFFATFPRPSDGVAAAAAAQRSLAVTSWPGGVEVRVRMGLHTGPVAIVGGNLVGMAIHAAARIEAAAHGGQIVVSATAAADLESSDDLALRSLGSHILRGITGRTELFQVDLPGLEREFPPLATEPGDTVPVPRFLADFVGRRTELTELARLLEAHRIVTITGPPGAGKTRLAAELLEGHHDVAFVDLASIEEASQVRDRMTAATGIRVAGDDDPVEALVRQLHEMEFVLLVDNCEHLVAEVAAVGAELVSRTNALRIVATSREPLAIDGEVVWPLDALHEAEELFVTRARAADASIQLEPDDPRVVAICERLDRLPLAVELAAAQVGRMPVDEVVARLEVLVSRLRSGRRDTPERHRTLRTAIDWSVRLLEPGERSAFRRLAVMRGAFDSAAAEEVTDEPVEVIAALHERSLLSVGSHPGRFRMLQTVRDAALALLADAAEFDEAHAAHARFYARRAAEGFHGLPTEFATLRAIDEDADNYRQAVEWLSTHAPAGAVALAVDLEGLWTARLSPDPARREILRVLDAASEAPPRLRASLLLTLADIDRNGGRVTDARRAAEQAVELTGDAERHDRFSPSIVLGQILALQGELEPASALFDEELRRCRERGDAQGMVGALRELANVAIEQRRPAEAVHSLDEATELAATNEGSRWMLGILASDRARVALALGDVEDARGEYEAAIASAQEHGIGRAIAGCSLGLAQVEREAGNAERAWPLLREALAFYRSQGDTGGLAHVFVETALNHSAAHRYDAAVQLLAAAEAARQRLEIATPGSEAPSISGTWAAALSSLGDETVKRLARSGRVAGVPELSRFV